jgi:hypothetical protein
MLCSEEGGELLFIQLDRSGGPDADAGRAGGGDAGTGTVMARHGEVLICRLRGGDGSTGATTAGGGEMLVCRLGRGGVASTGAGVSGGGESSGGSIGGGKGHKVLAMGVFDFLNFPVESLGGSLTDHLRIGWTTCYGWQDLLSHVCTFGNIAHM